MQMNMISCEWKVSLTELARRDDSTHFWSKFGSEAKARKEAKAELAIARKPMWVLPQLGAEYNQPASNHSHNATNHNHTAAHPWSNECSDSQANDDKYTWYD